MKKTITLLLAAAGVAMAEVTPQKLNLDWATNNITLSESEYMNAISFVFTIDIADIPCTDGVQTDLVTWSGATADVTSGKWGISHKYEPDFYGDPYYDVNHISASGPGSSGTWGGVKVSDYEKAIVGYTYGEGAQPCFYITLVKADGSEKTYEPYYRGATTDSVTIKSLYKYEGVHNIEVYGSILSEEQMAKAMVNIANPAPAVPEPTTATLSLLALAGLAARRRRK